MFRTAGIAALVIVSPWAPAAAAAPVYVVNFQAEFTSGFGGLPPIVLNGSYTFEALPATLITDGGTAASYLDHIRSGSFDLNGDVFAKVDPYGFHTSYLRVQNNIPYSTYYRDSYVSLVALNGIFGTNFVLHGAGLEFDFDGLSPTAFTTLALPLSTSDLDGFMTGRRDAVLGFENLATGIRYSVHAPVEFISIGPVPEPSTAALLAIGICAAGTLRRLRRP